MSRKKLRENKACQNCGRFVAERFCPHCGQENVETRHPFYLLFAHFFTDFIQYDNQFWRTIIDLYRPAKLPRAYLSGKRKSYVSPVQLYMFISFLVFFIPFILPDMNKTQDEEKDEIQNKKELHIKTGNTTDTVAVDDLNEYLEEKNTPGIVRESLKKIQSLDHKKFQEEFVHHAPKAIFLYMPVFAFWLWIFHSKRKWLYFDHCIYTLHYFSFVLLTILLYILTNWLLTLFHRDIPGWITFAMLCYFIYYFFHSHRKMYQESKVVSRTKCIFLFFINTFNMLIFTVLYFIVIALISSEEPFGTMHSVLSH